MGSLARKLPPPDEERSTFAADVLAGLSASPKRLPPKYFYDDAGSLLFERITELPEYYPTRCEMSILRVHAADICRLIPEGAALIEFGAGAAKKARILLRAAPQLAAYVPVDICGEMIEREAAELRADFPKLKVLPVKADITTRFALPAEAESAASRVGFFPGSTIGNFEPHEAAGFLRNAARVLGRGATLIIGVDLIKPVEILTAAYNDKAGVTSKFNCNLLKRINRELAGTFKLDGFEHMPSTTASATASRCILPAASGRRSRSSAKPSTSAPAKPSTPRTATSTAWSRSPRSPAASAGCRRRPGATPTIISPSRLSHSRAMARAFDFSRWPHQT